jgi:hypothetical protein
MKIKILLFATLFAFGFFIANAQTFDKGTKVLNLGIGLGGNYYSSWSGASHTPLLAAAFDVSILDGVLDKGSVGIGGYVGYQTAKYDYTGNYGWKQTNMLIGPRGTFHYPLVDKLDTYAGLLLGYHIVKWTYTGNWGGITQDNSANALYISGFIGARYYFTSKIGAYLELGSGSLGLANLGVAIKL